MIKINKSTTLLIMLSMIMFGCISKQEPPHPDNVPSDHLNDSIQMVAPQAWNTFKNNEPVSLDIINLSNRIIVFDQDFGKQIFLIQNDQLTEIEDKMVVINGQNVMMHPNESAGLVFRVEVDNKTTIIRVYVTGKFDDNNESVGAYLDIKLVP